MINRLYMQSTQYFINAKMLLKLIFRLLSVTNSLQKLLVAPYDNKKGIVNNAYILLVAGSNQDVLCFL